MRYEKFKFWLSLILCQISFSRSQNNSNTSTAATTAGNSKQPAQDQLQIFLIDLQNRHRKIGKIVELKRNKTYEQDAAKIADDKCAGRNISTYYSFASQLVVQNQIGDLKTAAEQVFEDAYKKATTAYEYPGEVNLTNCFPSYPNNLPTPTLDYINFVSLVMFEKQNETGCAIKECPNNGSSYVYVYACQYLRNVSWEMVFYKTSFIDLCKAEPQWRSCDGAMQQECKKVGGGGNVGGSIGTPRLPPPTSVPNFPPGSIMTPILPLPTSRPNPFSSVPANTSAIVQPAPSTPAPGNPPQTNQDKLQNFLVELQNRHRRIGKIVDLKRNKQYEQEAMKIADSECSGRSITDPSSFATELSDQNQMPDLEIAAEQVFGNAYTKATSDYEYPGEVNLTDCYTGYPNNVPQNTLKNIQFLSLVMFEKQNQTGCAIKECPYNGTTYKYVYACQYIRNVAWDQIFYKTSFIDLCSYESQWKSCKGTIEQECRKANGNGIIPLPGGGGGGGGGGGMNVPPNGGGPMPQPMPPHYPIMPPINEHQVQILLDQLLAQLANSQTGGGGGGGGGGSDPGNGDDMNQQSKADFAGQFRMNWITVLFGAILSVSFSLRAF